MADGAIFIPRQGPSLAELLQLLFTIQQRREQEQEAEAQRSAAFQTLSQMLQARAAELATGEAPRLPLAQEDPALAAFAQLVGTAGEPLEQTMRAAPTLLAQSLEIPARRAALVESAARTKAATAQAEAAEAQAEDLRQLARLRGIQAEEAEIRLDLLKANQPAIQRILRDPTMQRYLAMLQAGLGPVVEAEFREKESAAQREFTVFRDITESALRLILQREELRLRALEAPVGREIPVPPSLLFEDALEIMKVSPDQWLEMARKHYPQVKRAVEFADEQVEVAKRHGLTQDEVAALEQWLAESKGNPDEAVRRIERFFGPEAARTAREWYNASVPRRRRSVTPPGGR